MVLIYLARQLVISFFFIIFDVVTEVIYPINMKSICYRRVNFHQLSVIWHKEIQWKSYHFYATFICLNLFFFVLFNIILFHLTLFSFFLFYFILFWFGLVPYDMKQTNTPSSFHYPPPANFVFNLYDIHGSGSIPGNEALIMLYEIYGENYFKEGSKRRYDLFNFFSLFFFVFVSIQFWLFCAWLVSIYFIFIVLTLFYLFYFTFYYHCRHLNISLFFPLCHFYFFSQEIIMQLFGRTDETIPIDKKRFLDFTRNQLSFLYIASSVQKLIITGTIYFYSFTYFRISFLKFIFILLLVYFCAILSSYFVLITFSNNSSIFLNEFLFYF